MFWPIWKTCFHYACICMHMQWCLIIEFIFALMPCSLVNWATARTTSCMALTSSTWAAGARHSALHQYRCARMSCGRIVCSESKPRLFNTNTSIEQVKHWTTLQITHSLVVDICSCICLNSACWYYSPALDIRSCGVCEWFVGQVPPTNEYHTQHLIAHCVRTLCA